MQVLFVSFLIGTAIGMSGFWALLETNLIPDSPKRAEVVDVSTPTPKEEGLKEEVKGVTEEENETALVSSETTSNEEPKKETPIPTETPSETPTPTLTLTPTPTDTSTPTPTIVLTPTVTPTIKPITAPTHLEPLFQKYASLYGVDSNVLKKIADCESHFNNNAIALDGLYVGMYQFSASSWISMRNQMGLDSNPDLRYGAEESIQTAAYALSKGKASMWPSCSK